ncbi:MAG: alpha-L-rhamnosidase, partial [Chryseobacterium sp.]
AASYKLCFDSKKGVVANTPLKDSFSQHASIMAVLAGAVPAEEEKVLLNKVLMDTTLSQATFYYRFYLNQALKKAGMANLYYAQLKPWREMLQNGLTTFAENPDPTRSDCHAWSASPNYDFLSIICGIMPADAGFKRILIQPALGELKQVTAHMPHPAGIINLSLKRSGEGIEGDVDLPANLSGVFKWNGKEVQLVGGAQKIKF